MINTPYQANQNPNKWTDFQNYLNQINIPVIDYIAIGKQDLINKTSTSLKSDQDFEHAFIELASYDPIRTAIWNTSVNFFTFDSVDYNSKMGKAVMQCRKRFHIEQGLVYVERHKTHNFVLTLGTDYEKFDGMKYFIENNRGIHFIFEDLKGIV